MKILLALLLALGVYFIPSQARQLNHIHVAQAVSDNFNQQLICMAKNIYYEAASEPHEGKLAVAQVTINRANSRNYPSDFCGVVYQKVNGTCQFSWVCEKEYAVRNEYAWEEAMYIAKRAMTESVLHKELSKAKAMFFHATHVKPEWNNIRVVKQIGNHIFYTRT